MSSCRAVCLALLACGLFVVVFAAEEADDSHYPAAWATIDYKSIVDNDRLFKKYKECFMQEKPTGCPRDVTQFKKLIPEIVDSLCSKCLPEHIAKFKEGLEYICKTRRADFDEVREARDPKGEIQAKFEAKYGKINC